MHSASMQSSGSCGIPLVADAKTVCSNGLIWKDYGATAAAGSSSLVKTDDKPLANVPPGMALSWDMQTWHK